MNVNSTKNENNRYFAILDIGSNAIRFDIFSLESNPEPHLKLIIKERLLPKLARYSEAFLPEEDLEYLKSFFSEYNQIIDNFNNIYVSAVGTAVFRSITNAKEVISVLSESFGFDINILTGEEEAKYIVSGINYFEKKIPPKSVYIDIGGGSTEISWKNINNTLQSKSLPIGAYQISQKYNLSFPVDLLQYQMAIDDITLILKTPDLDKNETNTLVGSSGTIKALNYLYEKINLKPPNDATIDSKFPETILKKLSNIKDNELEKFLGDEFHRKDLLAGGLCILNAAISLLEINEIKYTKYSLRHGLLVEMLQNSKIECSSIKLSI